MISIAEAPSDSAEAVPAVTVPFLGSNTGLSAWNASKLASGRITSSTVHNCRLPSESCPSTPTISLSKRPAWVAAHAFYANAPQRYLALHG